MERAHTLTLTLALKLTTFSVRFETAIKILLAHSLRAASCFAFGAMRSEQRPLELTQLERTTAGQAASEISRSLLACCCGSHQSNGSKRSVFAAVLLMFALPFAFGQPRELVHFVLAPAPAHEQLSNWRQTSGCRQFTSTASSSFIQSATTKAAEMTKRAIANSAAPLGASCSRASISLSRKARRTGQVCAIHLINGWQLFPRFNSLAVRLSFEAS